MKARSNEAGEVRSKRGDGSPTGIGSKVRDQSAAHLLMAFARVRLIYDRGTLILDEVPAEVRPLEWPGIAWDFRSSNYRSPAFRHRDLLRHADVCGVRLSDESRPAGRHPDAWIAPDLRPYQEAALSAWEMAGQRGLIVLPTGSGKTRTAIAAMAKLGLTTLCLVPTRALLHQWHDEIQKYYRGAIGRLGDGQFDPQPITVSTFESAYRHIDRLGNLFDLLIIDEVHHFGSGIRDEVLEMSLADARLGLTATPPANIGVLDQMIGEEVFRLTVQDLTGKFLAHFDTVTLRLDLTLDERRRYQTLISQFREVFQPFRLRNPDARWEDFVRFASKSSKGRQALKAHRSARELSSWTEAKRAAVSDILLRHRGARILVFTADNATAYAIAKDHLIMPLTCDIGRSERQDVLPLFRDGSLRALVSARVLNEGIDVPDADLAIIVGGTLGEREHVQRIGRLLRPAPEKDRALIYELVTRETNETFQSQRRRAALHASTNPL